MTDLEKFLKLYSELGIDLEVLEESNKDKTIYMSTDNSLLFNGFADIYTVLTFDRNGKFTGQGFYEKLSEDNFF